jgi:hypothetical protein
MVRSSNTKSVANINDGSCRPRSHAAVRRTQRSSLGRLFQLRLSYPSPHKGLAQCRPALATVYTENVKNIPTSSYG